MPIFLSLRQRLAKQFLGTRSNRKNATASSSEGGHFVLETLEPRLLLSADPLTITGTASLEVAAADTVAPTAVLTAPAANRSISGTVTVTASASDDVGVAGVQFLLDNTVLGPEDTASPYSLSWNTTTATNGTHTLTARARDAAGNIGDSAPLAVIIDNQAPVGAVQINGGAAATNNRTVILTLSATDALSNVTQMRFSNTGTSFSAAESYGPTKTWTLSSGAGTKTVYAQFRDAAGNWSSSATDTIVLDTSAPTISSRTATSITTNSATITWTTSEPSTSKVDYGPTQSYGSTTTLDSNLVTSHSVTLAGLSADTIYSYRVRSIDAAGNERVSGNSNFRTAAAPDTTAPTVTINQAAGQADPTSTSPINFTVTFSETVTGFAANDISFAGSTVGGTLSAVVTGTGPTYNVAVSGMTGAGTVVVSVPAGAATDAAGNASLASTSTDRTVAFDAVAPTVTINQAAGQADPTSTSPINFTVTFSETVTGFAANDISFAGSTVGGTLSAVVTGTGPTYNVAVSGMTGAGTVVVSVPAGAATDAAGNASLASTSTDRTVAFDAVAPTVTINQAAGQVDPTSTSPINFTVTFSETVTGFAANDISFAGSTVGGTLSAVVTGTGPTYNVAVSGMTGAGTVVVSVPAGAATDAAGNASLASTSTDRTVAFDAVAPTVTINQAAGQVDPTSASPINFTVTFSETVTGFAANDISFAGSTVGGALSAVVTGTGPTYNVAVSGMTGAGTVVVSVPAGATTDAAGNASLASTSTDNAVAFEAPSSNFFRHEILASGFDLPTCLVFLPNGDMLVGEIGGTIRRLSPPYAQIDSTPFLEITNIGNTFDNQGLYTIALDPNFATNHYIYVFYTLGSPNHDRLSRFTVNDTLTAAGNEMVLYQDPGVSGADHHGGAIMFGNDGMLYVTTGEQFVGTPSQDLSSPEGKILRLNPEDGSAAPGNPFANTPGADPRIWAYGLRNPFRAYYDAPTGRMLIGDVGYQTYEEINLGVAGANYGWPDAEGPSNNPAHTDPIYYYHHDTGNTAIVAGFVYHGTQFPSSYQGSFFFGDYTGHTISRLTLDDNGNVTGIFNFEPADGSTEGPYGDIVYLAEGPEGALYYVDLLGWNGTTQDGIGRIHRISYVNSNLPPVVSASAAPSEGLPPLTVTFSSTGTSDPEGAQLSYSWNFGDGSTSTAANPTHTYSNAGQYQARLTASDGVNSTLSTPLFITVGNRPQIASFATTPADNGLFRAGDVISFSATATDVEDATLPASAYTWEIDFLHEGHVHPGSPLTGVTNGAFTVPTGGHDFSGNTRYRITLTVTDSDGLQSSRSVIVYPEKINLAFDTTPSGLTLHLDGIAHTGPFVIDTLVGFNHTIEARDQANYTFASWSDGGARQHTIVVPDAAPPPYTATFNGVLPSFVQVNAATPQTDQSTVSVSYASAQSAGNTNILAIGWNNTTSNITSVTDSAGNIYRLAVPTARGPGLSQAIYYATSIRATVAGANTVTVTFDTATPFIDIRALEYSGLDPTNPFDVGTSASGDGPLADSGPVATSAANELIFAAGMTGGLFLGAGANFTTRIITDIADIAGDRTVSTMGSYSATAPLNKSITWLMQIATFRAAGAGSADTVAPTVTGFAANDISFAGSTVGGTLSAVVTGTGPTYNVAVSGMTGAGTVVASVPAGAATDAAGNASLASTSTDRTVAFDAVAPTVTINQAAGQADPTSASPINFTVTFSETVTGFAANDISFAGSTVGGTLSAVVTGTGPTYNVAVSGMTGAGTVVVSVPAGAATDAAGNASLASTSTDNTVAYNPAAPAPISFVQVNAATPQTDQSTVTVSYASAQSAGNTNILAIGWNNTTSIITSVTDSAGNIYRLAVPTARGPGLSQAIYYATNIRAAVAGANTVTVTFDTATPFIDIRASEYSGLDPINPFDVGTSASGDGPLADSGPVATSAANELIFAAGMTGGLFLGAGANFTTRIITDIADIAGDRTVTTEGSYSVTAPLNKSITWLMQIATFRAAGQASA